jgi:RNA polymerase sigma factor (sigma-70 family)
MLNDEQLIKLCRRKDKNAQKLLFEQYAGLLLGVCLRYATDSSEAEDILQEGFVKIFLKIGDYSGKGSFFNWMRKIMINTAITNYYKTRKHRFQFDIEEVNEMEIDGVNLKEADFTHEELLNVIRDLPEGYRMVFNLFAIEGFKHKEIAEMLNIDINTSKSQYSRARRVIRKKLVELSRIAETKDEIEES